MPFNPDDYLAKKQTETAGPATGQAKSFDPNAYLSSAGVDVAPLPAEASPQSSADAYRQSNPPTPLSAATLGFQQGISYGGAKKIAGALDESSGAAYDVNQQEYPLISALGQFAGAVLSPSPVGKLKGIKEAGLLAKMAFNAADFTSRVGLSSFLNSNDPTAAGKLQDVQKAFENPLTIGLGALATLSPALPEVLRAGKNILVKQGDKAVALGKGMENALASEAGQTDVARAVGQFEADTMSAAKKGVATLGQTMDEIAARNTDTTANVKAPLTKIFDFFKSQKPEELLDKDKVALAKLQNFVTGADDALTASGAPAENASFQSLYEMKKNLGRLLFDPQTGAARTFANADPSIRSAGIKLYGSLSDALASSDKTQTFKEVSKAFTGTYRAMEAADDIGNSLTQMSNKLNVSGTAKRDALVEAYKSIPPQYLPALPELGHQVLNKMDNVITAYNIASKIAGQAPQKSAILSKIIANIPVVSEGSRLNMLNQLGRQAAGRTLNGAAGSAVKGFNIITSPEVTSGLVNNSALKRIE